MGKTTQSNKKVKAIISATSGVYENINVHEILAKAQGRAQEIIQEARATKRTKIKEARTEAAKEVESYRLSREKSHEKLEQESSEKRAMLETKMNDDVEDKMATIQEASKTNRNDIVEKLIDLIFDIEPVVHRNYELKRYLEEGIERTPLKDKREAEGELEIKSENL